MKKRFLSLFLIGMVMAQGMCVYASPGDRNPDTGEVEMDIADINPLLGGIKYYSFDNYEDAINCPEMNWGGPCTEDMCVDGEYDFYENVAGADSSGSELDMASLSSGILRYSSVNEYIFHDNYTLDNPPKIGDTFDASQFVLLFNNDVNAPLLSFATEADLGNYERYTWKVIDDATFYLIHKGAVTDTYGPGENLVVAASQQYYDDVGHFVIGDQSGFNPILGRSYYLTPEEEPVIETTVEEEPEPVIITPEETSTTTIIDEPVPNFVPWIPFIIITGGLGGFLWILWKNRKVKIHGALTEANNAFKVVEACGNRDTERNPELLQEIIDRLKEQNRLDLETYRDEAFGSGYITKIPVRTKITVTETNSDVTTVIKTDEKALYEMLQKIEKENGKAVVTFICGKMFTVLTFDFRK